MLKWFLALVGIALTLGAAVLIFAYREIAKQFAPPTPPLPMILRDATAGGGTAMSCEMPNIKDAAHSPEIVARLNARFPSGTPASQLQSYLEREGFVLSFPCPQDHQIRMATFMQARGGGMSYPARADIWWKHDGASIAWVTANIVYRGL